MPDKRSDTIEKMRKSSLFIQVFIVLLLCLAGSGPVHAADDENAVPLIRNGFAAVKIKRLFESHTSYEFGYPIEPVYAPLSRLEFPLDSWWGGIEAGVKLGRFSLSAEWFTNLSKETEGRMKDSDWDDPDDPTLRTIYSESENRLEPSYMLTVQADAEVADLLGLPRWLGLQPLAGFRRQDLNMVTHDGMQYDTLDPDNPLPLPGDGIAFSQTYAHYFVGLRTALDAEEAAGMRGLSLFAQVDWAYVEGHNRDHHLLRPGYRMTYENTYGDAWHAALRLCKAFTEAMALELEAEYLRIRTSGTHRLVNTLYDLDLSWSNGVRVWSDQADVSLSLVYRF